MCNSNKASNWEIQMAPNIAQAAMSVAACSIAAKKVGCKVQGSVIRLTQSRLPLAIVPTSAPKVWVADWQWENLAADYLAQNLK